MTQRRLYSYVGDTKLRDRSLANPAERFLPKSARELHDFLLALAHTDPAGTTFTYVIAPDGQLVLADRRSEHVSAAQGGPVLAAGEITLRPEGTSISVVTVTNQSTGYCPEPQCWPSVAAALERLRLELPRGFDPQFQFRRCERCNQINIIKDEFFYCSVCERELPRHWNFGRDEA